MKTWVSLWVLCAGALLAGCDESDAVALRLRLNRDLSGTLSASALERAGAGTRTPVEASGVAWKSQVSVLCAAGDFARISDVKISDLELSGGESEGGMCFLRLSLPRGAGVRWARELVPLDRAERQAASAALDPEGSLGEVGGTLKFEVRLPSNVLGNGIAGRTRGTKVKAEGALATLVVPVETATSAGDPIVWHLTWQK